MDKEVFDLANELCKASATSHLRKIEYRAALVLEESIRERLVKALNSRQQSEPFALQMENARTLVCIHDGEGGYEFSIIASYG